MGLASKDGWYRRRAVNAVPRGMQFDSSRDPPICIVRVLASERPRLITECCRERNSDGLPILNGLNSDDKPVRLTADRVLRRSSRLETNR